MHNCLDSVSLIKLLSSRPVDVQLLHLLLVLKTKNSVNAVINKSFDIMIGSWIRSKMATSISNLANGKGLKEVSIILIDESIDELNRVSVRPLIWVHFVLSSIGSFVVPCSGIIDLKNSMWISLPFFVSSDSVNQRIVILENEGLSSQKIFVLERNNGFIWSHIFTIFLRHPMVESIGLLHDNWR